MDYTIGISDIIQIVQTGIYLVTLIFLYKQIQDNKATMDLNTKAVQMSIYQEVLDKKFRLRENLMNSKVVKKKLMTDDFKAYLKKFSVEEYFITRELFSVYESIFLMHELKLMDDALWRSWANNMASDMKETVFRDVWVTTLRDQETYQDRFSAFIDTLIQENY